MNFDDFVAFSMKVCVFVNSSDALNQDFPEFCHFLHRLAASAEYARGHRPNMLAHRPNMLAHRPNMLADFQKKRHRPNMLAEFLFAK